MLPKLIKGIRKNSRILISQSISLVERCEPISNKLISDIYKYIGNAYRIGITGPPGAGKSSITNNLISIYRKQEKKVAVIAVDPTSPFSGGALLGDRIRMTSHYSDSNVFVRSMASRGGKGGLALKTQEVGDILDAAGYDIIIYETVGVGQIELDVVKATDTVVVILVPESGDEVQMLKAGLMEIGDMFAINKSDRVGAEKLMITLENVLSTATFKEDEWIPKVVQTIATEDSGTEKLINLINEHKKDIDKNNFRKSKVDERYKNSIDVFVAENYMNKFWNDNNTERLNSELSKENKKRLSPYELSLQMIEK